MATSTIPNAKGWRKLGNRHTLSNMNSDEYHNEYFSGDYSEVMVTTGCGSGVFARTSSDKIAGFKYYYSGNYYGEIAGRVLTYDGQVTFHYRLVSKGSMDNISDRGWSEIYIR